MIDIGLVIEEIGGHTNTLRLFRHDYSVIRESLNECCGIIRRHQRFR